MSDDVRFKNRHHFASIEEFNQTNFATPHTIQVTEEQRQVIIVALAELSLSRPGWVNFLEEAALTMDNKVDGQAELFEKIRRTRSDVVAGILAAS